MAFFRPASREQRFTTARARTLREDADSDERGGVAFFTIRVTLTFGKDKRPVVETFNLLPTLSEIERRDKIPVFALSAVKEGVRIYGDLRQARTTSLLNHLNGSREIILSLAGD